MFEGILQPTHLIIILVIVLVVFGPGKLPEIGGALGKSLSEFKRSVKSEPEATTPAHVSSTSSQQPAPQSGAVGVTCPSCGQLAAQGSEYCGHCGAKLV